MKEPDNGSNTSSALLAPVVAAAADAAATLAPSQSAEVIELCVPALTRRLRTMVTPAFLLELNIARIEGRLSGPTAQDRYAAFLDRCRDADFAVAFLRRYPVLARMVTTVADNWVAATAELCARLADDRVLLAERFADGRALGRVVAIEADAGDTHAGGRSVAILSFESGHRVVYKPRPLAIEVRFQALMGWLSARAPAIDLRIVQVLDRGAYGWSEFVAQRPVSTRAEAARFYRRTGCLLGIMYCLRADDLHHENLIANGEQPVVIDLESLFSPTLRRPAGASADDFWVRVGPTAMATGLLPLRLFGGPDLPGVDISGLGGRAGQIGGRPWPLLVDPDTDTARIEWTTQPTDAANNQLLLGSEPVLAADYTEEIVAGFMAATTAISANATELCAAGGPIGDFADVPIRLILRPTMQYALLAHLLIHPDHLHDEAGSRQVTQLLRTGVQADGIPPPLVESEIEQLLAGDIPYFQTSPDATAVRLPGGTSVPDVLVAPPMDEARERIADLTEQRLARECWVIRAALRVSVLNTGSLTFPVHRLPEPRRISRAELIAAAAAIADRLLQLAVSNGDELRWLTVSSVQGRDWAVRDTEPDLYDGAAGIALFLWYAAQTTGARRHREAAERATATALRRADEFTSRVGAFSGTGSLVYLGTHAGVVARDDAALATARRLALRCAELVDTDVDTDSDTDSDTGHDIIGGSAGLILVALALHRVAPDQRLVALACSAGDRLLRAAVPCPGGLGWARPDTPPLTGFAHGAAGIAAALAKLAKVTGDQRYEACARSAIGYERHLFSPRAGNWPDLRDLPELRELADPDDGRLYLDSWCHGAPGIGLGRCAVLAAGLVDPSLRHEIRVAADTTLTAGFGASHSLCHGDLGNLETLTAAAAAIDDPELHAQVADRRAAVFASVLDKPICGTPYGMEVPGLMMGLAGIGYGLLRGARPGAIPDVLRLQGPRR